MSDDNDDDDYADERYLLRLRFRKMNDIPRDMTQVRVDHSVGGHQD